MSNGVSEKEAVDDDRPLGCRELLGGCEQARGEKRADLLRFGGRRPDMVLAALREPVETRIMQCTSWRLFRGGGRQMAGKADAHRLVQAVIAFRC